MKFKEVNCLPVAASYVLLAFAVGIVNPLPIRAQTGIPTFQVNPSWPKVPENWALGAVSSVAVDEQDHVWILHRPSTVPANEKKSPAPAVLEFDAAGNFIQAWGGPGEGYEWPERLHGISLDHKGNVWIGGNNCPAWVSPPVSKPVSDDQLLKFTKTGKLVMQIGRSGQSSGNRDTKNLRQPADAFVYAKTNEVFVADGYGNHRVIVFDAETGAFKRMWGAFGNEPVDNLKCPPPFPAPPDNDGAGPSQFVDVHAARVSNDGLVYVADRTNRRVQVFTIDGKFVTQVFTGRKTSEGGFTVSPGAVAFSADPQQQFLYVSGSTGIMVLERKTFKILGSIGGVNVHHMATDSKGNIYTAETGERRSQKFELKALSLSPSR